jgi:integrase
MYNRLIETGSSAYLVIKIHTILSAALTQAVRLGAIPRNQASLTQPPKAPKKEMAILTTSQISQLLITANAHPLGALIHLALATGARQMELLGLKWTDLDWIKRTLKVERQLDRPNGNGIQFSSPKTSAGWRTITIDVITLEALRAHYEQQQVYRVMAKDLWTETGLIFCTTNGTPIHPRNLLRDFKVLLKNAGLPDIRFHDLRHTTASLLLKNGYSPLVVSKRLGHARTSITMDIYGHLHPSEEIEAAQKIGELITPIPVAPIAPGCTRTEPLYR